MNKRVFCCGFFFGVLITWMLSFYLYYSLNNRDTLKVYEHIQKNIFNSEESEEDISNDDNIIQSNKLIEDDLISPDGKSSYVKKKFFKEKSKRKPSQKLIDELQPVTIKQFPEYGIVHNVEDQFIRDEGYKTHAFNALVSNNIGNYREIPDTRNKV